MSCCSPLGSLKFVIMAPFLLAFLFLINWMTWSGVWWVQWAALGIGIAWVINVFRVLKMLVLVGGLAGLAAYLNGRRSF
jgi:hypothetical protein